MATPAQSSTLVTALIHKQVVTYFDVVAAFLLIYDYSLTFGQEYELVWPARWRLGKILFLLTRYLPFIDTSAVIYHEFRPRISVEGCVQVYKVSGWMFVIGIGIAEVILIVRTCALWSNERRLMISLSIYFVVIWTPICVILALFLNSLTFGPQPVPTIPGCFMTGGSSILFIAYILLMVFETSILGLTLFRGINLLRDGNTSQLISTLYKDGIMFYVYLFALSVINVVVLLTAPRDFATLLTSNQRVMHSLLTTRILLHLRGATIGGSDQMSLGIVIPESQAREPIGGMKRPLFNNHASWFTEGDVSRMPGCGSWSESGISTVVNQARDIELG